MHVTIICDFQRQNSISLKKRKEEAEEEEIGGENMLIFSYK